MDDTVSAAIITASLGLGEAGFIAPSDTPSSSITGAVHVAGGAHDGQNAPDQMLPSGSLSIEFLTYVPGTGPSLERPTVSGGTVMLPVATHPVIAGAMHSH